MKKLIRSLCELVRISAKLTLEISCRVCARALEEKLRVRIRKLTVAIWHGVGGSGRNPVCSFYGEPLPWEDDYGEAEATLSQHS